MYTFGFCGFDPRPLPVFDKLQFHVGDHTEDGDDNSAHASGSRDFGFKDAQGCAFSSSS